MNSRSVRNLFVMRGMVAFLIWMGLSQAGAQAPAHCPRHAPLAGQPLVVAILDTGVDVNHDYLHGALWGNPGETGFDAKGRSKENNGIDDDGNGFVDDVHGWNFAANDGDVSDPQGHGTHIAGLILSRSLGLDLTPDSLNPVIPAPVRFMVLKYHTGSTISSKAAEAFKQSLRYALDHGAQLIHISGGGYGPVRGESALLAEAQKRGIPVVAASGNKRVGQPDRYFFPASYTMSNIVSVIATDSQGRILPTSNATPGRNDVREIGDHVYSILPGQRRGYLTGTSQAAGAHCGKFIARMIQECSASASGQLVSFLSR